MSEVFKRARLNAPCVVVLEDLDAMIDKDNRAFFLNELDGFHPNTGLVVLASTNHPEKLDSSILDRPSRFDRKYYFQLPADAERRAYVDKWNYELQPEMRVSEESVTRVVSETQDFSFAYLKELFVTSMVQWMSSGGSASMDEVLLGQTELLRGQMNTRKKKASGSSRR
jgi:AAA+ superfamily predicted ATPase